MKRSLKCAMAFYAFVLFTMTAGFLTVSFAQNETQAADPETLEALALEKLKTEINNVMAGNHNNVAILLNYLERESTVFVGIGFSFEIDVDESSGAHIARIKDIVKGSPAESAGLIVGTEIFTINGEGFSTAEDVRRLIKGDGEVGKPVRLFIRIHNAETKQFSEVSVKTALLREDKTEQAKKLAEEIKSEWVKLEPRLENAWNDLKAELEITSNEGSDSGKVVDQAFDLQVEFSKWMMEKHSAVLKLLSP